MISALRTSLQKEVIGYMSVEEEIQPLLATVGGNLQLVPPHLVY